MATTRPQVFGGTINVADSTDLAALDITGLPLGSRVANQEVGEDFVLTSYSPDERDITLAAGDNVDADTRIWTFENGAFYDGNLYASLTVSDAASDQNNGVFVIEEVISATEVKTFPRSVPLVTEAFDEGTVLAEVQDLMPPTVEDEIVAVTGQSGIRWVVVTAPSPAGVETVTGPGVDNTDPANPTIGEWTVVTVSGAQTDVTICSGLDLSPTQGIEIEGDLGALAGTVTFSIRPDNTDANCRSVTTTASAGSGAATVTGQSSWPVVASSSGNGPSFGARVRGGVNTRHFSSTGANGPGASTGASYSTIGHVFGDSPTSFVLHASATDGIPDGSVIRWRLT